MKTCLTFLTFLLSIITYGQKFIPVVEWEAEYKLNANLYPESNPIPMIRTMDEGYVMIGNVWTKQNNSYDCHVIKTDKNGKQIWEQRIGTNLPEIPKAICETYDRGYVITGTGFKSKGIFLIKINSEGHLLWEKGFGQNDRDESKCVIQTQDNGFLILGEKHSKKNRDDIWILKTDKNGKKEWEKSFGGKSFDKANYVIQSKYGDYVIVGSQTINTVMGDDFVIIKLDGYGEMIWERYFREKFFDSAFSVIEAKDKGYVSVGYINQQDKYSEKRNEQIRILKVNRHGDKEWERILGDEKIDEKANHIIATNDGGFLVSCIPNNLIKIDDRGYTLWEKKFNGQIKSINQLENGKFVLGISFGNKIEGKNEEKIERMFKIVMLSTDKIEGNIDKFVKNHVEENINEWQKKKRYEKVAEYKNRVNYNTRRHKINDFEMEAVNILKKQYLKTLDFNLLANKSYDPDNETLKIGGEKIGDFIIPIPRNDAKILEQNWSKVKFQNPDFVVRNNHFKLSYLELSHPDLSQSYLYDIRNNVLFEDDKIDFVFEPFEYEKPKIQRNPITEKSSVDVDIPINKTPNPNTFALIIGNENYTNEIPVPFAQNDAQIFQQYCQKTLGIPTKNIRLKLNATYGELLGEIEWLKNIIASRNGEAKVIVYYAGHGIPDNESRQAYLLPSDGNTLIPQTALSLQVLFDKLTESESESVVVFLDACFSGASREGLLADGRGVVIRPKSNYLKGNLVVMSATSGEQTAFPYDEKGHGLFTYFLLKKLQETKGNASLKELSDYLNGETGKVNQTSVLLNDGKKQTPEIRMSQNMRVIWKDLKLR